MDLISLSLHLAGFAAPAAVLALLVALVGGRMMAPGGGMARWLRHGVTNFAVGIAILLAGLWHFGVDGKMATYAALVAAVATSQWLCSRGWKG
jgi:hypothetical protein